MIDQFITEIAEYIIETGCTVRECAEYAGVSKSLVHYYMTRNLPRISIRLYNEVRAVLEYNLSQRHIRGGDATREKYKRIQA